MTSIVLIGFMGTGKSAVGRVLARSLNVPHIDTDTEIERVAGRTIPEIFTAEGEAAFRLRETAALASLAAPSFPLVLSTGGGTPLRAENAALLKQIGTVVWLQVTSEAILARVGSSLSERPLLTGSDSPLHLIENLLRERSPRYAALADYTLDTTDCAEAAEAADRVLSLLSLPLPV